jgi:hypothetical protein
LATVGGGYKHLASGALATVGGGGTNTASGYCATVGGGHLNQASADYATVAGGGTTDVDDANTANRATDIYSTVGGGGNNQAGDGDGDPMDAQYATVGGGESNIAGRHATVGGGASNKAEGTGAAVGGGWLNSASGPWATVPGGSGNVAAGRNSFAAGHRAKANADGCFVWGGNTDADVVCSDVNSTVFRASGGFLIYSSDDLSSGVWLLPGDDAWNPWPPGAQKENFQPLDTQALLEELAALEIGTWNYTSQDPAIRHIGPKAQDFNALLPGLGGERSERISSLDADGVALAAIQGLYAQNQSLSAENAALRLELADLASRLSALEALLGAQGGADGGGP